MKFTATELAGAYLIEAEPVSDERGSFARLFCARELAEHGLDGHLAQASLSVNKARGTLRGMHYQAAPYEEAKVVRCARGRIFDVLVDLRPGSTLGRWIGLELSPANQRSLYVPPGVAHGFQTLEPASEVLYFISRFHEPASARGVRHDDPAFAIRWPGPVEVISARDAGYPDWRP